MTEREDRAQELLAQELRARAASVDGDALARGVAQRLAAERPRRVRLLSRAWVRVAAAIVIAAGLFALFARRGGDDAAYAATREIVAASRAAADRTYRVTVSGGRGPLARVLAASPVLLHTRGDRFFAQPEHADVEVAWGSERLGEEIWVAARGHFGLERLHPGDHPMLDDVRSMDVRRVLEGLLSGFELSLSHEGDDDVIDATRRDDAAHFVSRVRVWARSDRLVVDRMQIVLPASEVELRLLDEAPIPDDAYTLVAHLAPGDPTFTGRAALLRIPALLRLLTR